MRKGTQSLAAAAGLAVLALVAAACGGSSGTSSGNSSPGSQTFGQQGLNPGGTPKSGGTLNMLGQGDVDFMDYNVSYYTIGGLGQRPWLRGLLAYPAIPGKSTTPAPNLATAMPTVTNGGKTYKLHHPHRCDVGHQPATAGHRGRRAARPQAFLQPDPAVRRPAGLRVADRRLPAVLQRLRQGPLDIGVRREEVHRDAPGRRGESFRQTITYSLTHPASYFPDMLQLDASPGPGGEPELPTREQRGSPAPDR